MKWPRSIRWRYSLRALFVFITLFMIWGGYHANRGCQRRAAEQILSKHGASYSLAGRGRPRDVSSRIAVGYETVVYLLWGDIFAQGMSVTSPLEPEVVDALVAIPPVKSLSLTSRPTTSEESVQMLRSRYYGPRRRLPDGAMDRILAHHNVRGLSLAMWDLDDDDCQAIAKHRSLVGISLLGCRLPEDGFARLLTLPVLRRLRFAGCDLTGEKLVSVPGTHSLESITCYEEPVGKEFAAFVGRSPKVTELYVSGFTIDDEFVSLLGAHPSLRNFDLEGSVTNQVAESLLRMPALRSVDLPPKVSDEAIARLKKSKPNLLIH